MIQEQIEKLLAEKFEEEEYADCFIIEVNWHAANKKLEVFVDSDSNITFEKCKHFSRYLSNRIEEDDLLPPDYRLEVSSPGVKRPLKFARQYVKNTGRKLDIQLNDGSNKTGTLISTNTNGIILEEKVKIQEGKRKKTTLVQTEVAFDDIKKAIVKVSF